MRGLDIVIADDGYRQDTKFSYQGTSRSAINNNVASLLLARTNTSLTIGSHEMN